MADRKRSSMRTDAAIETQRLAAVLGSEARSTRRRRRRTQGQVADAAGISRSRCAELERGGGVTAPLDVWVRVGLALGRPLAVSFSRDIESEPADAGHLAAQELVLGIASRVGRRFGAFELPTRPSDPSRSADICIRDDDMRLLILIEIWNRMGDLGAAARSTARKRADLEAMAMLAGGDAGAYRLVLGWLLVDTAANRRLVAAYPAIFRANFPGSSPRWVRSLAEGQEPPEEPAVAWIDTRAGRLAPLRIRGGR
jgi:transcriptional regulator with XRE-family HTH domain